MDKMQAEAAHNLTPPARLRDIFKTSPPVLVLRLLAQNPNTPTDVLWDLASQFPREVLENPILPLLYLENSDIGNSITETAALGFLCLDDLPSWMLSSFQHGPLKHNSVVRTAVGHHCQIAGEADENWMQSVEAAILKIAEEEASRTRHYGATTTPHCLELKLVPDWLARPLAQALRKMAEQETGTSQHSPHAPVAAATALRFATSKLNRWQAKTASGQNQTERTQATKDALLALKQFRQTQRQRSKTSAGDSTGPETIRDRRVRARDQNTSEELLRLSAEDEARVVRVAVARNPNAPPDALELLSRDEDAWVRGALARNERLPAEVLERLAKDEHCIVRANVARHPGATPALLREMAADHDGEVLHALSHRPDLAPETRVLVAQRQKDVTVWGGSRPAKQMARDSQTPPHVLDFLARTNEADETVRRRVAENRKTPAATLRQLATDPKYSVRAAVAANPATPVEVLQQLFQDTFDVRKSLASNTWAPVDMLLQLMDEDKPLPSSFHLNLAENAALPLSALERLFSQVSVQIDEIAAEQLRSPATPSPYPNYAYPTRSELIMTGYKAKLFAAFISHPNASSALRRRVRELRRHDMLMTLATSRNDFPRTIALGCPQTPTEVLEASLFAPNWIWRLAITRNPATPLPLMQTLARDGNRFVRKSAAESISRQNNLA